MSWQAGEPGSKTYPIVVYIALFYTNRVHEYIFMYMTCIFIFSCCSIWIGVPKTHLRRFRLAAGALFIDVPF